MAADKLGTAWRLAKEAATVAAGHERVTSAHEGWALVLEEVDELKLEVWRKKRHHNVSAMRKEALDVAARAIRFAMDVEDLR